MSRFHALRSRYLTGLIGIIITVIGVSAPVWAQGGLLGPTLSPPRGYLEWSIIHSNQTWAESWENHVPILYPGEYNIRILLARENLGCSLRVETKSSIPSLMKLSGPLAVFNETKPEMWLDHFANHMSANQALQFPIYCRTTGTISVSHPPTVAVPAMMTLTYGPALTKTAHLLLVRKVGIQSVSALPEQSNYSLGQRITMNVNFTRKRLNGEKTPMLKWRVPQGKLCNVEFQGRGIKYNAVVPDNGWRENDLKFDGQPLSFVANLCVSGQTSVEVTWNTPSNYRMEEKLMTDPGMKGKVFNVTRKAILKKQSVR